MRLTTAAQFYDKDDQTGLTEIGPTGLPALEAVSNNNRGTGLKVEPTIEEIPPWSQNSLEKHSGKSQGDAYFITTRKGRSRDIHWEQY